MTDTILRKNDKSDSKVTDNPMIIDDRKASTSKKLEKTLNKEVKTTKKKGGDKKKAKTSTEPKTGGKFMDRLDIERIVRAKCSKAKVAVSQTAAKASSSKPGPLQVRNSAGEVILAVRAGEVMFHLPHKEVIKEGRAHGGGWPHGTKLFYGTCTKTQVERAIARALADKKGVAYWKEEYGSTGRKASSKVDPKAKLKALMEKEAKLKKELAAAKKALAKSKPKSKKKASKSKTKDAISKVAEAVA